MKYAFCFSCLKLCSVCVQEVESVFFFLFFWYPLCELWRTCWWLRRRVLRDFLGFARQLLTLYSWRRTTCLEAVTDANFDLVELMANLMIVGVAFYIIAVPLILIWDYDMVGKKANPSS